ncbi:hypothetical protein QE152_g6404 [Popillia japonica]|uniref:DDE-1 domain-containing protein n=1 Tax=Popillia japonica TaxID=7064 RepID=A0AAW1MI57_POPJA
MNTRRIRRIWRDNGVALLQLPGHTTHRLQPLVFAVFKPLATYVNQAVEKWMRENSDLAVTQYQLGKLLGEAYGKAATARPMEKLQPLALRYVNGFCKCGIWAVHKHGFRGADFAGSDAILKENEVLIQSIRTAQVPEDSSDDDIPPSALLKRPHTRKLNTTFEEIICIQRPSRTAKALPHRNSQQATVLTTTSYKNELEERRNRGNAKGKRAVKRQITSNKTKTTKRKRSDVPLWQL